MRKVLCTGLDKNHALYRKISHSGYEIIKADTIEAAVDALRHEEIEWVLIMRNEIPIDIIELILNLRDVDPQVPVRVVGQAREDRALGSLNNVQIAQQSHELEFMSTMHVRRP